MCLPSYALTVIMSVMTSANLQSVFDELRAQTVARSDTGCWEWQGPVFGGHDIRRYARVGRKTYGHRLMYQLVYGLIPAGQHVCHRCDNTLCLNPDHLFTATNAENRQDSVAKRRHAHGERAGGAKLTAETVVAIREARATGLPYKALVAQFGVPFKTIEKVCTGATWRSAGGPIGPQPRTKRGPYARSPERGPDGRFHA